MLPKKKLIDRAKANGTIYRTNILLSAAHLAAGISNNLYQEAADALQEAGLHVGEIKKLYNNYLTASDRYFADFSTMITDEKTKYAFFSDLDKYTLAFRQLVCIEDSFTPSDEGEEFHPDLQAYIVAKQKQLKELERLTQECKSDIARITEKLNLAGYGLTKGQYFIYRGVEYGNVSCNDKDFLHAHRVKENGELYKKQEILCISYEEKITPLDKFYKPTE